MNHRLKTLRVTLSKLGHSLGGFGSTFLYHGTTLDRAKQISLHGFDLSRVGEKAGQPLRGISTSVDREIAVEHAIWAGKKFNSSPALVVIDGGGLRLASGKVLHQLWDEWGDLDRSLEALRSEGFDGVQMWNEESGEGIEEWEVLIFEVGKIKILRIDPVQQD